MTGLYVLPSRPSWDDVWMATALTVARRSLCSRAQVGSVIVSADNLVQAVTYNGPAPAFPHNGHSCVAWCQRSESARPDPLYDDCPATHAEASGLVRADRSRIIGGTIYASSAMCMPCAKLVGQSGIVRVVHRIDPAHTFRDPERVEDFLRRLGIDVTRYTGDVRA